MAPNVENLQKNWPVKVKTAETALECLNELRKKPN